MTTEFGLIESGFRPMRLDDVQDAIVTALQDRFGVIDTSPESVVGQFVGIGSKIGADIWEQMDRIYVVQHPSEAYAVQLDYVVEYNGLTRLDAQPSFVIAGMNGTPSTVVPQGTQLKSSLSTGDLFELTTDTEISNLSQSKIYVRVDDVQLSTDYTITLDATPYTINSGGGATEQTIAEALVNDINGDALAVAIASYMGDGDIMLEGKDQAQFDTTVTSELIWFSPGSYQSLVDDAILVLEDTINIIETPVGGLDEVNNFEEGIKGRDRETDAELQLRRENSLQILGAATLPAIVARMIDDVPGVVTARGFENRTDLTSSGDILFNADFETGNIINLKINGIAIAPVLFNTDHDTTAQDLVDIIDSTPDIDTAILDPSDDDKRKILLTSVAGKGVLVSDIIVTGGASQADGEFIGGRPPHSIEIVVSAPDTSAQDELIGYQLWNTKGGGAALHSSNVPKVFFDITDENGDIQRMFWTRPIDKYVWVVANITLYDEEIFPADGIAQVEQQILDYGNTFTIGLDIIPGRFKGWIYNVPGIDTVSIQIATTKDPGGTPSYVFTRIPVGDAEQAVFLAGRIEANII